ncbi:MAG: hypothetical protein Q7S78_01075 [Candidatus Azambacteria bacterium]|nr:hypothetical protein [Candidatus Azambacteria bacterium]
MDTPIEAPVRAPKKEILMIAAVILIIGLAIGGYFWWDNSKNNNALDNARNAADKITESATQGVLPSIGTNPLESKPDVNPADKANPFKNIITNPFQ